MKFYLFVKPTISYEYNIGYNIIRLIEITVKKTLLILAMFESLFKINPDKNTT